MRKMCGVRGLVICLLAALVLIGLTGAAQADWVETVSYVGSEDFSYKPWGQYLVTTVDSQKYFAGYTANNNISYGEISTLRYNQLHTVLLNDNYNRSISVGGILTLSEGYVLKVKDVDITGGNIALFSLLKDGNEVDTTAIQAGKTYFYSKKVGNVSDIPIIAAHLNSAKTNIAVLDGIFQISEGYYSGGSISVSSSPSSASIYLDGSNQGITPRTITGVSTGSHTITLRLAGYQDLSQTGNVTRVGSTSYVTATLKSLSTTLTSTSVLGDFSVKSYNPSTDTPSKTIELTGWRANPDTLSIRPEDSVLIKITDYSLQYPATLILNSSYSVNLGTSGAIVVTFYNKGTYSLKAVIPSGDPNIPPRTYAEATITVMATTSIPTATYTPPTTTTPTVTVTPAPTINPQSRQIHNIHIGPGTAGLQCDTCHGFPPVVPPPSGICNNCHPSGVPTSTIPTATYITPTSDTSPPSISISKQIVDSNKNGQLDEGEKLVITYGAVGESDVKSIKVLLDGNLIELRNKEGIYSVTTDSLSMGEHSIVVEAIDSKENKKSEEMKINAARAGPSVYFPKSRYEVNEGDDFDVVLSAVNPIGNPKMDALLILKPPGNGVSTYESDCKGFSGQCTGKFEIEPGDSVRSVSARMRADRAGEYQIDAEVYYQFENSQRSPTRYETLTVVVKPKQTTTPINMQAPKTSGFENLLALAGVISAFYLRLMKSRK